MVFLHALGQCLIRTGIATIGPRAELGFALATRMVADRGRRFSRRHLTALFWPDVEEQKAAHSLSEALHRLRARGVPIETDSTQAVWIERDAATLDVEQIPDMHPVELARCDFTVLPGFEPRGAPALRDWADEYRHQLTIQTVRNLAPAIARAEREGDWESALALAEHALRLDSQDPAALRGRATAAAQLSEQRTAFGTVLTAPKHGVEPSRSRGPEVVRETSPAAACELRTAERRPQPGKFFGREAELDILRDAWGYVKRGHGRRVVVHGPSGIGKTRLVRQFRTFVRQAGGVAAEIQSEPGDSLRPLSAFLRLVPTLRSLPGAAAISPDLRPYLDRLTDVDRLGAEWPDAADRPYTLTCIERAIDELLESIADEQPLIIVVDNAQSIDAESRRLLDILSQASSARAVLFIEVTNETESATPCGMCVDTIPIRVGPLRDEAAHELVVDRIHGAGRDADDVLVQWLTGAGNGIPLLLEEIIAYWLRSGRAFDLPPSLSAALTGRINLLTPDERHALQAVAMLGHQATIARVQRVAELGERALLTSLDALGQAGLIEVDDDAGSESREGGRRIRCRHDAIAAAALGELSAAGRAVLHRAIAIDLERDASTSADMLWDRVSHWGGTTDPADAVRTTISCARHLTSVGLADAGAVACQHLLDRPIPDAARRELLLVLTNTLHQAWRWRDVLAAAEELRRIDACHRHDDAELCTLDARWQLQLAPGETLRDSVRCASARDASNAHRLRAAEIAIKVATNAGDLETLHEVFHAVAPTLDDPGVQPAERLTVAMMYHAVGGSLSLAAENAWDLVRQSDAMPETARLRALINCASALARAGECDEALALCARVEHDALRRRLIPIATAACHRAANVALDSGNIDAAREWTERFAANAANDDQRRQKAVLLAQSRVAFHDADPAAETLLSLNGTPLWVDATPAFAATSLATAIGVSAETDGCEKRLRALLAEALPRHRHLQKMGAHDFVTCALAVGYYRLGEAERAESLVHSYMTQHRRERSPLPEPFAAMLDHGRGRARSLRTDRET